MNDSERKVAQQRANRYYWGMLLTLFGGMPLYGSALIALGDRFPAHIVACLLFTTTCLGIFLYGAIQLGRSFPPDEGGA